jgi:hypothetical protein
MGEIKSNCPDCHGPFAYPKQLAGSVIDCPHCGEELRLPVLKPFPIAIALAIIFALSTVALAATLMAERRARSTAAAGVPRNAAVWSPQGEKISPGIADSPDMRELQALCSSFYECINKQDIAALRELLAPSCNALLSTEDLKPLMDGSAYEFQGIDSVKYENGKDRRCALASVRRTAKDKFGAQDAVRNLLFVKEAAGWKLFRHLEVMHATIEEFSRWGLTGKVKSYLQILRDNDPFERLDNNDTNALETVFATVELQPAVFPWNVSFQVTDTKVDGRQLTLNVAVRNKATVVWDSPFIKLSLKQAGKVIEHGSALLPDMRPGEQSITAIKIFLDAALQETATYELDVFYTGAHGDMQLSQNVPVKFAVPKLIDSLKFEVVRASFDRAASQDLKDFLAARIDYRIKNIGSEPVKDLSIRCVWFSLTGELLDQSTDYAVGYGDVPLAPGQTKSGFIRCGQGYDVKVPVRADIFVECGEQRSAVVKGLLVK